jgi:hypothetical protein
MHGSTNVKVKVTQFHGTPVKVIALIPIVKVRPSPMPIFTKLTNGQQRYVQTCYTEFQQNRPVHLRSTDARLIYGQK